MKLAIETYSELSGYSFEYIVERCQNKDDIITQIIIDLMFVTWKI